MSSAVPQRFIYKRFFVGDNKKLQGKSNIAKTGGGAKDVRIGPWSEFEPIVKLMFPRVQTRQTQRKDPQTGKYGPYSATVHIGTMLYQDKQGNTAQVDAEFWEPTGARSTEGRLAVAGKLPPFAPGTFPSGRGSVFMLIAQDSAGYLGGAWVTEHALRHGSGWYKPVQKALLDALDQSSATTSVRGLIDLTTGEQKALIGTIRRG
jgi:hypothetical protein